MVVVPSDVMVVCRQAFPGFKFMDVSRTLEDLPRYMKGLVTNPHVVLLGVYESGGDVVIHVETVGGGTDVFATVADTVKAVCVLLVKNARCSKCLIDVVGTSYDVHFSCPTCGYLVCMDCHNVEMEQTCVCGHGCLLSDFEEISVVPNFSPHPQSWWRWWARVLW